MYTWFLKMQCTPGFIKRPASRNPSAYCKTEPVFEKGSCSPQFKLNVMLQSL